MPIIFTFSDEVSELDKEFALVETLLPAAVTVEGPAAVATVEGPAADGPAAVVAVEGPAAALAADGPAAVFAAAELLLLLLKQI